ncbi:glycosyltransferase [Micromonospora sp. NPDC001898]|uniref:glycosyltransferase n=1 Tax=Micromonospora sp. NPDC001898 TaxID=3364221 RepID=UPI0036A6CDCB
MPAGDARDREMPPRVVLLGFTLSDEALDRVMAGDAVHSTQTHAFAWGLVRALRDAGCPVRLLSAAPVSTYPRNPRIRYRAARFRHAGVDGQLLGFVNLLGLKHLTRFAAACRRGSRMLREQPADVLLVHGVHTPFLWAGLVLGRLRGVRVVPVLTDPPGVPLPHESRLVRLLRSVDVALVRAALRRCAGVVALTGPLAEDFAPGRPRLVLEGICAPPVAVRPRVAVAATRQIVYAGGLSRAYGVDRLVEAFRGLPGPDLRLCVFGRGELEGWLHEQAALDPRVVPPRLLDRGDLAGWLAGAAVLVNPRPVDQHFVPYSFPSKLIEYLSAGVPVVTTRLPGIPADYDPHLVYADDDSAAGLRNSIRRVLELPPATAAALGAAGRSFVAETRNPVAQGRRLRAFLGALGAAAGRTDAGGHRAGSARQPAGGRGAERQPLAAPEPRP